MSKSESLTTIGKIEKEASKNTQAITKRVSSPETITSREGKGLPSKTSR